MPARGGGIVAVLERHQRGEGVAVPPVGFRGSGIGVGRRGFSGIASEHPHP
jgi:hypothetical protein